MLSATWRMKITSLTSTRVTIHNGDHKMSLEMLSHLLALKWYHTTEYKPHSVSTEYLHWNATNQQGIVIGNSKNIRYLLAHDPME